MNLFWQYPERIHPISGLVLLSVIYLIPDEICEHTKKPAVVRLVGNFSCIVLPFLRIFGTCHDSKKDFHFRFCSFIFKCKYL